MLGEWEKLAWLERCPPSPPVLQGDALVAIGQPGREQHDVRVPLTDVRQVETGGSSSGRTVGLGVGVAGGVVGAFLVAYAIACRAGGCSN